MSGREIRGEDFVLRLDPIRENIVRCRYSIREFLDGESLIIEKKESNPEPFDMKLAADVDPQTGAVTWKRKDGTILVEERAKEFIIVPIEKYTTGGEDPIVKRVKTVDGERNFIQNLKTVVDHESLQGRLYFRFRENERIFGLGQGEDGVYNYRHHTQYLYQHNMRIPMPMFLSDQGYGILFDCTSLMTFNDTEFGTYMFFDAVDQLDYYVIAGDRPDEIIDGFRYLTGNAVLLPKWAYGYIQSKEQYYTATEMKNVVRRYRELGVPIDCIVQDWNSWPEGQWGQKSLDPARYSNIEEEMQQIHDMHVHSMVSVWPNMNTGTPNHTELFNAGYMLNDLATYDAFEEKAREIYFRQAREGLYDRGFDSWWCDSTEPFSGPDWGGAIRREPWVRYQLVGTEHKKYLPAEKANAYALVHAKGIFENQRKYDAGKRVLNLTRSGYASGQKYGAMLWSGDITAAWSTMRKQIAEGLNMAMSGYPYWTLDIGGFFTVGKEWTRRGCSCNTDPTPKWFWKGIYDDGVSDQGYCELYTRWIQLGCFLPMFRSHGTDTPREIWNFGSRGEMFYDAIERFIKLRYRLMPYIYSAAGAVAYGNKTIMRSLLFDFTEDEKARDIADEFLFGESILVCPVLEPMYYEQGSRVLQTDKKAEVYLPAGCGWYDFWTGEKYDGGQTVVVDAPIDRIPLFIKAGSIIPMEKGLSYAAEKADTALEVHVYDGADGSFTFYDDNGEDYSYETGNYEIVRFDYCCETRTLTIGQKQGNADPILEGRVLEIYRNGELRNTMKYDGTETKITL